jgi:hypothetical protein
VHALTEGDEIHFAQGRFEPGTLAGKRLIAHELAHVAQQRRPGAPSPELAAELDADLAAEALLRGETPRLRASVAPGTTHAFEAWEHRQLGGAYGGEDRKIRLPNGLELTYGQIVALGGDFYRSPEALLRAPRSEVEAILHVMADEQSAVARSGARHAPTADEANAINAAYELATTGHSRVTGPAAPLLGEADTAGGAHGEVREGEHVESGAPGAEASFLDLASANPAHFSPENIALNWIPKHRLALDLARRSWQARHPGAAPAPILPGSHVSARAGTAPATAAAAGLPPTTAAAASAARGRPDPSATSTPAGVSSAEATAAPADQAEAQAWLTSAFSDHFLTDAFASGHLISGSTGRTICQTFYTTNRSRIVNACFACAVAEGMRPDDAALVVPALDSFLSSRASSLLLKTVHDFYNRNGVEVRNALGQVWRTYGDAHLGGSADTITMGELASKASRDAVQDVLSTGGTTRAEAALDYIPDLARLSGGPFKSIAAFSVDPAVWAPVLVRAVSPSPAVNDLYQLVKGNIGPMGSLYVHEGGRWVRQQAGRAARAAGQWAHERAEEVRQFPGRLEREIKRELGVPF